MKQTALLPQTKLFLVRLSLVLAGGVALTVILHLWGHTLPASWDWLTKMFDLDTEKNVPTWFASILWFLVAVGAGASYLAERLPPMHPLDNQAQAMIPPGDAKDRLGVVWLIIAFVFLVASCDEVATIHEEVGSHLQTWHSQSSLGQVVAIGQHAQTSPNSPWIIFYAPFLILFGIGAIGFLWKRLASRRVLLIYCFLCVNCFCMAIAADHFQGLPWNDRSRLAQTLHLDGVSATDISVIIEETLENLGCVFLVLAFTGYAHDLAQSWLILSTSSRQPPRAPEPPKG